MWEGPALRLLAEKRHGSSDRLAMDQHQQSPRKARHSQQYPHTPRYLTILYGVCELGACLANAEVREMEL